MKKKKLVKVVVSLTLGMKPTPEEIESLKKLFPGVVIHFLESWERESKIK